MSKHAEGSQTHYVCQLYEERPTGSSGKSLAVKSALMYTNAGPAEDRAERSFRAGYCVGADAFRIVIDPDTGDADEPIFLARLGKVPEIHPA